ncbi:hypothetical protein HF1_13120 [Mycoplasma haemofelis str. Langford 1]|uniref:Uncharacterized protein n=1 Tax=Mycoplasma haemofelis (strain Langford 1) TaxID=941640 RepID=E8ZJJ9_MYCHL|nr:hypothetical protein [Mycoplasma haemofelis]CBY93320.1 hypothetical protein HF1_13120 [Mycoplasma haemofelis str. Langford 1]
MATTLAKGLMGLGGLSVAGGGGLLAANQGLFSSKEESIQDRMKKDGYKALDSGSADWGKIFDSYKDAKNTKKFQDDGITSNSTTTDHPKLKEQCSKALKLKASEEETYKKVIKWCVVPRKVEDVLAGITLLGVEETNTGDANDWKPILTKYTDTKKGDTQKEYAMKDVVLKDTASGTTNQEAENIKELKKGCKSRRAKMTYELEFEQSIEEVKTWCSK